ncbi:MAG: DUF2637 domain-containing protein [Actinoallomurus sp.]
MASVVTSSEQKSGGDQKGRGHPVHALGDSPGERAAVCAIGIAMLVLALIGMYVSFQTVYEYVRPWFRASAWTVPIAIDVAILVFSAADLLLSFWRMAKPTMRLVPWGFTAATIWLNWQAGGPIPIRLAHGAMPALWVLFCEYARHVLAARVGLVRGERMEKVRRSRWLLAPLSTARMRRRMILWEITSYRRALELEAERRAEIARLEMAHGRRWRRRASARDRLALKLAAVAPADVLPSLAATIGAPAPAQPPGLRQPRPMAERPADTAPETIESGLASAMPAEQDLPGPVRPRETESGPADDAHTSPGPAADPAPADPATVSSARQRAAALLAAEPDLPGTELARRLGVTTGYGRRLRSELLNSQNGYR